MMGGKTPETCSAVNKRQDNKLKICCTWLVIYLNCTMMHGFTGLKLRVLYINYKLQNGVACIVKFREIQIFLKVNPPVRNM